MSSSTARAQPLDQWPLQKRQILRNDDQAERQHPDSQNRQKAEDAPKDQKDRDADTRNQRRWLAQPVQEPADAFGQPLFDFFEIAVEFGLCWGGQGMSLR